MRISDPRSDEAMSWLYSFTTRGIKLDLENTRTMLERLGNPQNSMRSVHVAGTDGKGSVCACISSMLISSGIKTGLFTSPHIEEFNERITVNGIKISNNEISEMKDVMKPIIDEMESEGMVPTFFEVSTVLALLYFREKGVEYAVIEVGMGGRLDSTNIIVPEVSVISNISMDHEDFLGNSIEEIAFEKAGIIKPGVPCVTMNDDVVFEVLKRTADERDAKIFRVSKEDVSVEELKQNGTRFLYKEEGYFVSIPGSRQADNASLAIETVSKLKIFGHCVRCNINKGLKEVRWPCRMERIDDSQFIVDVTHTAAGSAALAEDIKHLYDEVDVVIGMLSDKDIENMSANLSKISQRAYIAELRAERTADIGKLRNAFEKHFKEVIVCEDIPHAMEKAFGSGEGRNILVTGSFHTAEEALDWLKRTSHGSWTYSQRSMTGAHIPGDRRKV